MESDQETIDEQRSSGAGLSEMAAGLASYAHWFATSRQMHHAAEQAAERDAPSCPR